MNVATEIISPNIAKSLFLELENKEGNPVETLIKFMKNCINAINPITSAGTSVIEVIHINRKNIEPKIEKIKELTLKPE